mmetsp:Transcript_104247/g.293473  ORF Transcript_104247/g.293473 Transcript_104247/m.293473 type:complete len:328 (-) Transcript_104247:244-1227(-)
MEIDSLRLEAEACHHVPARPAARRELGEQDGDSLVQSRLEVVYSAGQHLDHAAGVQTQDLHMRQTPLELETRPGHDRQRIVWVLALEEAGAARERQASHHREGRHQDAGRVHFQGPQGTVCHQLVRAVAQVLDPQDVKAQQGEGSDDPEHCAANLHIDPLRGARHIHLRCVCDLRAFPQGKHASHCRIHGLAQLILRIVLLEDRLRDWPLDVQLLRLHDPGLAAVQRDRIPEVLRDRVHVVHVLGVVRGIALGVAVAADVACTPRPAGTAGTARAPSAARGSRARLGGARPQAASPALPGAEAGLICLRPPTVLEGRGSEVWARALR